MSLQRAGSLTSIFTFHSTCYRAGHKQDCFGMSCPRGMNRTELTEESNQCLFLSPRVQVEPEDEVAEYREKEGLRVLFLDAHILKTEQPV